MNIDNDEAGIVRLIPQKPPFVMVGKAICSDEMHTETEFYIRSDTIFVEDGFFREPGLIENMAQTMAVRGGLARKSGDKKAQVGMIGAVKNFRCYRLPRMHTTIRTRIVLEGEILGAAMIRGAVFQADEKLAECEMKIFMKEDNENLYPG
ncbi:MAG: pseudouridylate synthase [Bacteroidales bacterium]